MAVFPKEAFPKEAPRLSKCASSRLSDRAIPGRSHQATAINEEMES